MKFFTNELWDMLNSDNANERNIARQQWDENSSKYSGVFENVKKMPPKNFLKVYYANYGFHDYQLVKFDILNDSMTRRKAVNANLIIGDGENTWNISYKNISKISIEYNYVNPEFQHNYGFDDYGYDEFIEVDKEIISHEILFASGATLLIHFRKISVVKVKNSDQG